MKKLYWKIKKFIHRIGKEKQTCPRRMDECGPWLRKENDDYWLISKNGDRTCSFCGSLHPDDFERCLDLCLKDVEKCQISPSDKDYKIYVIRPEVYNASDGGIKFYIQHSRSSSEDINRINPKLNKAVWRSIMRKERIAEEHRQELIKQAAKEGD